MLKIFDELESKRAGTRNGIPRVEGEALYTFVKDHGIKRVIETGIEWGFSSYYILAALPNDGLLISLDSSRSPHIGSLIPAEWFNRWQSVCGTSKTKLQELFLLNREIDFFFHDSDHHFEPQMFEFETALPFVNYIGSHDVHLYGPQFAWDTFIKKHNIEVLVSLGQLGIGRVNG